MPELTTEQRAKTDPNHPIHQVMERITLVQNKMLANDPEIGTHLKEIHAHLREYEELAHLLSPEEIGIVMKGLQKHTAIQLVVNEGNKSAGKKKKPTVDDLI